MKFRILAALAGGAISAGCAAIDDSHFMPSEGQLQARNPKLLNCAAGAVPSCTVTGTRFRQRVDNCRCIRPRTQ